MVGEYMLHLRRRGLTQATRETYLKILKGYLATHQDLTLVTPNSIEGWLDDRRVGPRTRYSYISAIQGYHRWLLETGRAEADPSAYVVKPKLPRRLPRPARTDDLVDAMEHAPLRMRAWLALGAYSGLRCMEIAGLRVEDVRLDLVPPSLLLHATKGGKDRLVPLAEEVIAALDAYGVPIAGAVFPPLDVYGHPRKGHLGAHYVSEQISLYLHGRGINATAHQLRHWFGTEMYRLTHDLKLVAELMGHAQVTTTASYCALRPSREAIEALRTLKAGPGEDATKGVTTKTPAQAHFSPYWDGAAWVESEAAAAMAESVPWAAATSPGVAEAVS